MAQFLKQSTAVDVLIGPFVDLTDGSTAEAGESPSVKLSKNGQSLSAKNDATTPAYDKDGYYNCELDATDTNLVGTLILTVAASANALPVRHEFQVVEEAIYDAIYGASATGLLPANVTQFGGSAGAFTSGRPEVNTSHWGGTAIAAAIVRSNLIQILDTTLTEASGQIAAGFKQFFNIASPTSTMNTITAVTTTATATDLTNAPANGDLTTTMKASVTTAATAATPTAAAVAGNIGGNVTGSVGSISGVTFPTYFADLSITETTGLVDITQAAADKAWGTGSRELTAGTNIALAKGTGVTGFNDLSATQVNAEVVDVLATDTHDEPGSGTPGADISLKDKIGFLYKAWRNKTEQTDSEYRLFSDGGSIHHEATVTDDSSTFTREEMRSPT